MKFEVHLGKPQPWVLPITIVCLALGALIATMINMSANPVDATQDLSRFRPDEQVRLLQKRTKELETEIGKLREDKDKILDSITSDKKAYEAFKTELQSLRIATGSVAVEGRGISITIDDSHVSGPKNNDVNAAALLTHDIDLLMLVNELRAAGAEAVAINDQRVVNSTAIRCVGPVIQVNFQPVSAPFVVKAIGKPDVLSGAVNLPNGVLMSLEPLGIHVVVAKRDKIQVPAIPLLPAIKESTIVPAKDTTPDKP